MMRMAEMAVDLQGEEGQVHLEHLEVTIPTLEEVLRTEAEVMEEEVDHRKIQTLDQEASILDTIDQEESSMKTLNLRLGRMSILRQALQLPNRKERRGGIQLQPKPLLLPNQDQPGAREGLVRRKELMRKTMTLSLAPMEKKMLLGTSTSS